MTNKNSCHHCEGLGYTEIRDCSGEIQRSETCSFCSGTGYIEREKVESLCELNVMTQNKNHFNPK